MIYGYINPFSGVSQNVQEERLQSCEQVHVEAPDKEKKDELKQKKEWQKLLEKLRPGDELHVYALHIFPFSTLQLIHFVDQLNQRKVELHSYYETIENQGMFTLLEKYQRQFRKGIANIGVEAKRKRGTKGGRKAGLDERAIKKAMAAASMYKEGKMKNSEIMEVLEIGSKTTLSKYLKYAGIEIGKKSKK